VGDDELEAELDVEAVALPPLLMPEVLREHALGAERIQAASTTAPVPRPSELVHPRRVRSGVMSLPSLRSLVQGVSLIPGRRGRSVRSPGGGRSRGPWRRSGSCRSSPRG
jgi:hypothetical protein